MLRYAYIDCVRHILSQSSSKSNSKWQIAGAGAGEATTTVQRTYTYTVCDRTDWFFISFARFCPFFHVLFIWFVVFFLLLIFLFVFSFFFVFRFSNFDYIDFVMVFAQTRMMIICTRFACGTKTNQSMRASRRVRERERENQPANHIDIH